MKTLFYPESMAVFGVSESKGNFGKAIVKNLIDFHYQGKIVAIGQKLGQVFHVPIHTSITEVDHEVESAIFLIPAAAIPPLLEECGQKGVKRAVISSGGFSEFNPERKDLEEEILAIAKKYNIRFLGPNCIGIINQDNGMCLPFVRMGHFPDGPVTLFTQSGGVGLSIITSFTGHNIGINKYVSLGNKLNIGEADIIPFLEQDESTQIICMYLEEISKGREFLDAVRQTTKPVVVYKANTTAAGAAMAASHTAAVANDDRVVDAALHQAGVVRVDSLLDMATACSAMKLPPLNGNRLAVVTPTGGHAVICADEADRHGFELPPFPEQLIKDVEKHVRAGVIKLQNPLDLGDMFDLEMYATIVLRLMQEPTIDALMLSFIYLVNGPGASIGNIFPMLKKLHENFKKPIALTITGNPRHINDMRRDTDFPIFECPAQAIRALAMLRNHSLNVGYRAEKPELPKIDADAANAAIDAALEEGKTELAGEAMDVLRACGVSTPPEQLADSADAAASAAADMGFPVALKIASPDILHKTEAGGVAIGLRDDTDVREAFGRIMESAKQKFPDANVLGVTVQKMITGTRELLMGINYNEQFGHVVVFGLGGIYVEAIQDVAMRIAPLTRHDAEAMLDEIRAARILGPFRGMGAVDREALVDLLLRLSALTQACPRVRELDINPLMAPPAGEPCVAVDARMVVAE